MMDGSRTVLLCKRGRLHCHAVTLDGSVKVRAFPVRAWWHPDEFGLRPAYFLTVAYPIDRAVNRLLRASDIFGITEAARRLLEHARKTTVPRNQAPKATDTGEAAASGQEERLPQEIKTPTEG